jgi:hypothetical protein
VLHALPSSHEAPSAFPGFEQMPVCGLHAPATWHVSSAAQTVPAPVQTPAWQASLAVQALPSLQGVPSGLASAPQPITGSHAPAVWH